MERGKIQMVVEKESKPIDWANNWKVDHVNVDDNAL